MVVLCSSVVFHSNPGLADTFSPLAQGCDSLDMPSAAGYFTRSRKKQEEQEHVPGPSYSERLKKAIAEVNELGGRGIRKVAKACSIAKSTLSDHVNGKTKSSSRAHVEQQLVSPEYEDVIVDWAIFLEKTGHPLNKKTIIPLVVDLVGIKPGKNWLERFLERHSDVLKLGKACRLDPKRAKAFNYPTVKKHFDLFKATKDQYDIPWENIYNMDEKGIQLGGGRKNSGIKYILSRKGRKTKYRAASDNLELVTVVECVCADGSSVPPGFVFQGKRFQAAWFKDAKDLGVGGYGLVNAM